MCATLSPRAPADARNDSRAIEYPVMTGFMTFCGRRICVLLRDDAYVHKCAFCLRSSCTRLCVCLLPSGSRVCVCACVLCSPRSTPRHAVRVRWQFPCLAVTEECILLQSELAAGCFDAALCYGSGIITLPVIKTKTLRRWTPDAARLKSKNAFI